MFSRLVALETVTEGPPPFDPTTVDVQGLDEEQAQARIAEAERVHVAAWAAETGGRVRHLIVGAMVEGIGEFAGERISGEIIVRPGGMLVFNPVNTQRITTPDAAIADAHRRQTEEIDAARASAMDARTGGEHAILPDAARVPASRPPRRARAAKT